MDRARVCALVALAGALGGCEFVRPPTDVDVEGSTVVVHGVLNAGADRAAVLITRVRPSSEFVEGVAYPIEPGIDPLAGAEVWLGWGADSVRLTERGPGAGGCRYPVTADPDPGCYGGQLPSTVRSGLRYRLTVRLPEGRVVTGEAVAPPEPVLVEPEPRARIEGPAKTPNPFDYLWHIPVVLDPAAEIAGISAALVPLRAFVGGEEAPEIECTNGGTHALISLGRESGHGRLLFFDLPCSQELGGVRQAVEPDSVQAVLQVTAHDAAYMRYQAVLAEQAVREADAAQGISGAFGLFSGTSSATRPVTLVRVD